MTPSKKFTDTELEQLPEDCFHDGAGRGDLKGKFISVRFTSSGKKGVLVVEQSSIESDSTMPGYLEQALRESGLFIHVEHEDRWKDTTVHLRDFKPKLDKFIRICDLE